MSLRDEMEEHGSDGLEGFSGMSLRDGWERG
jgi:hypothetical protein